MPNPPDPRIDAFLQELRRHLSLPPQASADALEELTLHARAQFEELLARGWPLKRAASHVIGQFESPAQLGRDVSQFLPLQPPVWQGTLRILLVLGMSYATWDILWMFRSWFYGPPFLLYGFVLACFLPFAWALWPGMMWRTNHTAWKILTGGGVVLFLLIQGSRMYRSVPAPLHASFPLHPGWATGVVLAVSVAGWSLSTLLTRPSQRYFALLIPACLVLGLVEGPYQLEERTIRTKQRDLVQRLDDYRHRHGEWPTDATFQELAKHGPLPWGPLEATYYRTRHPRESYCLTWVRPLAPMATVTYSSATDTWTAND